MKNKKLLASALALMMCGAVGVGVSQMANETLSITASAEDYGVVKLTSCTEKTWLASNNRLVFNASGVAAGTYTLSGSITLIRDGVSYKREYAFNAVHNANGNYYIDNMWVFGNDLGVTYVHQAGDRYVIEGVFSNASNSFTVEATTIVIESLNAEGKGLVQTVVTEKPPVEQEDINLGHGRYVAGWTNSWAGNYYPQMSVTYVESIPAGNYKQVNEDAITFTRDGVTYNLPVGDYLTLSADQGGIRQVDFTLWPLGNPLGVSYVAQAGDVLTINGKFTNGTVTFEIQKTEITFLVDQPMTHSVVPVYTVNYANENGEVTSTVDARHGANLEKPADLEKEVNGEKYEFLGWFNGDNAWDFNSGVAGDMTLTPKFSAEPMLPAIETGAGYDQNVGVLTSLPGALSFGLAEHEASATGVGTRYKPMKESCLKVVRGGQTYEIGHTLRETITQAGVNDYLLECWTLVDYKNFQDGDQIIVEGRFICESTNTVLNIGRTVFTVTVEESVIGTRYAYSVNAEKPVIPALNIIEAGSGAANGANNVCSFYMEENEAPYSDSWALRYTPVSADAVKRIRGEETTNVGNTGAETIVKYSETGYALADWAVGAGSNEWQDGDIYVIDGYFTYQDVIMKVDATYLQVVLAEDGTFSFVSLNPNVTFVDADGNVVDKAVYAYGASEKAVAPTAPEKAADAAYTYTFAGWYNGETAWNFDDAVVGNLVLTATYTKSVNVYTLTIVNGETSTEIKFAAEVADGVEYTTETLWEALYANLPAEDNEYTYAFAEELPMEFALENYTFTVVKSERIYEIAVITGNPRLDPDCVTTITGKYGEAFTLTAPTAEGKTFAGWVDIEDNAVTEFVFSPDLEAVYATWDLIVYTVTIVNGEETTVIKFAVESDPVNEVGLLEDVAFAVSIALPEATAEYTYAFAEEVPTAFEYKNYTFTVVATAVEVTPPEGGEEGGEEGGNEGEVTPPEGGDEGEVTPPEGGDEGEVTHPADSTTSEVTSDTASEPSDASSAQGGCFGVVGGVTCGITMLGAAAVVLLKKKEN